MFRRLLAKFRGHGYGHFKTHGFLSSTVLDGGGMPFVGPSTALHYTPVYRAATLISNDVARTAVNVARTDVETLLAQPNRWTNGFELRRSMTLQALLYGNAFAAINRTMSGELLEILPLDTMSVQLDMSRAEPFYRTTAYGELPLGVISPNPLNAAARQYVLEDWMKHHSGAANAGKPLVLGEGMKVERISSTLDDQGIAAARRYSIEDVARMYGVPTSYLSEHSANAYGSMEWLSRMYVDACLSHWFAAWAAEIEAKLTPGESPTFDTDTISRPSLAEQMAALRTGVEAGVITRNEARAWLDLEPLPGLDEPTLALNVGTGGGTTNIGSDTSAEEGAVGDFT